MIKDFESFNESFLGINISKIKKEAYKYHSTKECRKAMAEIDISTLNSAAKEVQSLGKKWGSIENFTKKLISKSESKNESMAGAVILTIFGLHALIKLIKALKDGWSLVGYLSKIFYTDGYDSELRTLRDIVISVVFLSYTLVYCLESNMWSNDTYYISQTKTYINMPFRWDGINDYKVTDSNNKIYKFKRIDYNHFDIYYNGKKIGMLNYDVIYNLHGQDICHDIGAEGVKIAPFDLEKAMSRKVNSKITKEIDKRTDQVNKKLAEIDSIEYGIDSLRTKSFENVDQTRKMLSDKFGIDYDQLGKFTPDGKSYYETITSAKKLSIARGVFQLKELMTRNNTIGYLSTFSNMLIDLVEKYGGDRYPNIERVYDKLMQNKNLIDKLRDNDGNLKQVTEFRTLESLDDAIDRVKIWARINEFIKQLPPTQKRLIWKDGWFVPELKDISQYISNSIINLLNSNSKRELFLQKVSSIKDRDSLITSLSEITKNNPWNYNFWLKKLENTRNVIITWKSEEEKQIICAVFSFASIKKIAYMTNWCIVRDRSYFTNYSTKGCQYILYDFSKDESDDDSIVGFTTKLNHTITDCNSKSDRSMYLDHKFYENVQKMYNGKVQDKYIKFRLTDALKKLDMSILNIVRSKIRSFLQGSYIGKFVDWYDDEGVY